MEAGCRAAGQSLIDNGNETEQVSAQRLPDYVVADLPRQRK